MIGPVIEYSEIEPGLDERVCADPAGVLTGILLVASGLVKVYILAYFLKPSADILVRYNEAAPWQAWVELFLFALVLLLQFRRFSDVAIGTARLFGFQLKPNFNNPYMKTNPQDLLNSWHMSLTRFAKGTCLCLWEVCGSSTSIEQYSRRSSVIVLLARLEYHARDIRVVSCGWPHGPPRSDPAPPSRCPIPLSSCAVRRWLLCSSMSRSACRC